MDQRRHVQLDELLIERVPEAIAQARRGQGVALGGIGIEDAADEAKLPDAALQLLDAVGRALGAELRQAGDALQPIRKHLDLLVDQARKSVGEGKRVSVRVDLGGGRLIKQKKIKIK